MSLKWKYLLINLLFGIVIVLAVAGGVAVISLDYTKQLPQGNTIASLEEANSILDKTAQGLANPSTADQALDQLGYKLLWVNEEGTPMMDADGAIDKHERAVITRYGVNGRVVTRYGMAFIRRDYDQGTLYAVDDANFILPRLQLNVMIFEGALAGLLILIGILNVVIDNSIVMPRLRRARDGLQQLYRGNFDVELHVQGKRRDDIDLLMVDIEAVRRKLNDLAKQREAFDREQGVMISGISHDLRTPLTVIKTNAKGLIDGVAQRLNKAEEYYERIYQTANDMTGLVDRLSSFGKGQNREVMYSFADRDLVEVLKEFVKNNYYPYAARGLEIKANLPVGRKVWVSLDKEQANRIWQNIADNALKYKTAKTGHLVISMGVKGDWVLVRLADDGPGIKDFEADYIFESYYRGDPSRTNPISGSGLGLAIVRNVVTAHHGDVRAYNNHGLTIEIKLPLRRK
ncbi:MAG: HAMP domain-containing histidine kinase [Clostridia bacterium]|nr:HAMP domain-containing histidine kinase [Clostridia bacterium]